MLVTCHNNTAITITPTQAIYLPMNAQDPSSLHVNINSGDSHTVILHELQTLAWYYWDMDTVPQALSVVSGNEWGPFLPISFALWVTTNAHIRPNSNLGEVISCTSACSFGGSLDTWLLLLLLRMTPTWHTLVLPLFKQHTVKRWRIILVYSQHTFCSIVTSHPILVAHAA